MWGIQTERTEVKVRCFWGYLTCGLMAFLDVCSTKILLTLLPMPLLAQETMWLPTYNRGMESGQWLICASSLLWEKRHKAWNQTRLWTLIPLLLPKWTSEVTYILGIFVSSSVKSTFIHSIIFIILYVVGALNTNSEKYNQFLLSQGLLPLLSNAEYIILIAGSVNKVNVSIR